MKAMFKWISSASMSVTGIFAFAALCYVLGFTVQTKTGLMVNAVLCLAAAAIAASIIRNYVVNSMPFAQYERQTNELWLSNKRKVLEYERSQLDREIERKREQFEAELKRGERLEKVVDEQSGLIERLKADVKDAEKERREFADRAIKRLFYIARMMLERRDSQEANKVSRQVRVEIAEFVLALYAYEHITLYQFQGEEQMEEIMRDVVSQVLNPPVDLRSRYRDLRFELVRAEGYDAFVQRLFVP